MKDYFGVSGFLCPVDNLGTTFQSPQMTIDESLNNSLLWISIKKLGCITIWAIHISEGMITFTCSELKYDESANESAVFIHDRVMNFVINIVGK